MSRAKTAMRLGGLPLIAAAVAALTAWAWGPGPWGSALPRASELEALAASAGPVATLPLRSGSSLEFHRVVVTGYTSSIQETDSTPFLTASMTTVANGTLALSRDLLRAYTTDAPFDFGDCVLIPNVGIFIVEDTMNPRWHKRADIWFADRKAAVHWGRRRAWIARLPKRPQEEIGLFALGIRVDEAEAFQP